MGKFINCAINCARNVSKFGGSGVASGLLKLFNSLSNAPTFNQLSGYWEFLDTTGSSGNIKIVKKRCLNITNAAGYVTSQQYIVGSTAFHLKMGFKSPSSWGSGGFLFRCGYGASQKGINAFVNNSGSLTLSICDGTNNVSNTIASIFSTNTYYDVEVIWDGTTEGLFTIIINGVTRTYNFNISWTGNSTNVFYIGFTSSSALISIGYCQIDNYFRYIFNHGAGTVIYNLIGATNGAASIYTAWSTIDGTTLEPFAYTEGVSIYYNYSTPGTFLAITGNYATDIYSSGFVKVGYFAPGSGIVRFLANTYLFPDSINLSSIQELIDLGIYSGGSPVKVSGAIICNLLKNTRSYLDQSITPNNLSSLIAFNHLKSKAITINDIFKKELFTVGDSLSAANYYQNHLTILAGAIFSNTKNIDKLIPLSIGGTATRGNWHNCGQFRSRNLVNSYPNADVLFYENINDFGVVNTYLGTYTDAAFMLANIINHTDQEFTAQSQAVDYWTNNFASIVAGYTPTKGSVINVPYYTTGKNVKITGTATADGNITLTVDSVVYTIAVTTSDTILQIATKILTLTYGLIIDTLGADNESVNFAGATTVVFSGGTTGVTATVASTSNAITYYPEYFVGEENSEDWANAAKWSPYVSLWSAYKGLFNYLKTNLPTCDIRMFIPTRFGITKSNYPTWNDYKLSSDYLDYKKLTDFQKEVASMYSIEIIDMLTIWEEMFNNFSTYYNDNDVHPKLAGYIKWAEEIFNNI